MRCENCEFGYVLVYRLTKIAWHLTFATWTDVTFSPQQPRFSGSLVLVVLWFSGSLVLVVLWFSGSRGSLVLWFLWFSGSRGSRGSLVLWFSGSLVLVVLWFSWSLWFSGSRGSLFRFSRFFGSRGSLVPWFWFLRFYCGSLILSKFFPLTVEHMLRTGRDNFLRSSFLIVYCMSAPPPRHPAVRPQVIQVPLQLTTTPVMMPWLQVVFWYGWILFRIAFERKIHFQKCNDN